MTGQGAVIGGRYRLEELVGQGGMGRVWRGHDQVLDRRVAIKELVFPALATEAERETLRARATREAKAAARLSHPGVVTVHDVVSHDGVPWIVMEFIDGLTLTQEIAAAGALGWPRAAQIGATIAGALAAAHAAGIVHRDLKPDNVLVSGDRVVVADFGIAWVDGMSGQLTVTGTVLGTTRYMAPEQLEGHDVGPPADLWALGGTLYAMTEGRAAFDGPTLTAVVTAVLTGRPAPARNAGPLAPLISWLLARDPAARPAAAVIARRLSAGPAALAASAAEALAASSVAPATAAASTARAGAGHAAVMTGLPAGGERTVTAAAAVPAVGMPAAAAPAGRPGRWLSTPRGKILAAMPAVVVLFALAGLLVLRLQGPAVGDACLIGTWRSSGGLHDSVNIDGTAVAVQGGAGNLDYINAAGTDVNVYGPATKPLTGVYENSPVAETIRGTDVYTFRASPASQSMQVVNDGFTRGATDSFTYQGKTTRVTITKPDESPHTDGYTCTDTTLTFTSDGVVTDKETRLTATPP